MTMAFDLAAQRRRRRNLLAVTLLPLCYLLLLPGASEQGLASILLAPAGLQRSADLVLAVVLLQVRLITVLILPGVAAVLFATFIAELGRRAGSPSWVAELGRRAESSSGGDEHPPSSK